MLFAEINNLSEHNFVAPYKLIGEQALSVDRARTLLTLFSKADSITIFARSSLYKDNFYYRTFALTNSIDLHCRIRRIEKEDYNNLIISLFVRKVTNISFRIVKKI